MAHLNVHSSKSCQIGPVQNFLISQKLGPFQTRRNPSKKGPLTFWGPVQTLQSPGVRPESLGSLLARLEKKLSRILPCKASSDFLRSRKMGTSKTFLQSVWYSAKKDQSKLSGIPPSGTSPNFLGSRQVGPVQTFWDPNKCDQSKLSCQLGAVQTFWFLAKLDHSKLSGRLDTRNFYGEGTGHIFISQSFVDDITELSETEKTFWELLAEKFYWLRTAKPAEHSITPHSMTKVSN